MIFSIQREHPFNFIHFLVGKLRVTEQLLLSGREFWGRPKNPNQVSSSNYLTKKVPLKASTDRKKQAEELINEYRKSDDGEEFLRNYINGLEKIMFMTHHKLRQPVANILGMASVIEEYANSPETLQKIVGYMKQSAIDLDTFSRDLSKFVADLDQRVRE